MMTLSNRLRAARMSKGMSLRDVERATGGTVSNGYLSLLEKGSVKDPSPRHLQRLATALDIDYAELMELAGYLSRGTVASGSSEGVAFSADEDLTPDERAQVENFIKFLRSERRRPRR